MGSKRRIRVTLLVLVSLSALVLGFGYVTGSADNSYDSHLGPDGITDPSAKIAPPAGNVTVITTDSNTWRGLGTEGPRSRSQIVAFDPDGRVRYQDHELHTRYWDVDPVPGTETTVEYVYADHVAGEACNGTNASRHEVEEDVWNRYERARETDDVCTRNGIDRVNLTTGEVTSVWSRITPGKDGTRYHDADRINETHYVVADIYLDGIFVVDVWADEIVWRWNASDDYSTDSGGPYPKDWTHINDVEVVEDGRFMVSMRNHDQVVFVDVERGVDEEWTLGSEDDYDVLYEQHNPDYIPESDGGPAIIVSDSENRRVQEFQRVDGEWERTWSWSDRRMQWPRDADRLPDGNTLVADSNGDRVFEIDASGAIVWSLDIAFPYEAERLGTGDESTDGPSKTAEDDSKNDTRSGFLPRVGTLVDGKYLSAALYVSPTWIGPREVVASLVCLLSLVALVIFEVAWLVNSRRR